MGGGWWCLNHILVFSLSLSQAEQQENLGQRMKWGKGDKFLSKNVPISIWEF